MSLQAAHGKGVIHRDLKPGNLFVTRDPAMPGGERVKVLDFGIAKLSRGAGEHKTETGAVLGTPAYMSPEQCRGLASIDHRTDIYSLGTVLFCLVTGRALFQGEGEGDVIIAHVRDQPPVPSSIVRGVPGELDAVILRCLEKEPARRYQTMGELVTALGRIEPGPRERAAPTETELRQARLDAPVAATLPPCGITTMSDAPGEVTLGRRTAPRRWIGLALAASAASVVAVVIAYGSSGRSAEETTSAGFAPTGAAAPAVAADAPAEAGPDRSAASLESPPVERVAVDASISIDARSGAAPVESSAAPRPEQVQGTRNTHRGKGGVTPHGSDTTASPDDLDHIQRRD